jgi:hypothetical protein
MMYLQNYGTIVWATFRGTCVVCPLGASLTVNGGSLSLSLVLLFGTCVRRCELLPTPLRDAHWTSSPQEKYQHKRLTWVRMKYVLTSLWASLPRFLQPFTTLSEEWAREAPHVLKPKVSYGLLQVSPSYPKGGLQRRHVFIMPHSVCIYVHKIVL